MSHADNLRQMRDQIPEPTADDEADLATLRAATRKARSNPMTDRQTEADAFDALQRAATEVSPARAGEEG